MAPEGETKRRVVRKLTKKRKESHQVTMEIPERFKDGDDADHDYTSLQGGNAYMNQSVFGMIAAAGSQVDFNARFDGQSSDEEEDSTEHEAEPSSNGASELQVEKTRKGKGKEAAKPEKHRRKFSENKLLRSLPRLSSRSKSKSSDSPKSPASPPPEPASGLPPPVTQLSKTPSRNPPVMSRMLEAKAELSMRPSFDISRSLDGHADAGKAGGEGSSSLTQRLMEIFQFEKPEDVIEGRKYK